MSKINQGQVVKTLRKIVKENPGRTNGEECIYFEVGDITKPVCIVGHVFAEWDLNKEPFLDELNNGDYVDDVISYAYPEEFEPEAISLLARVQAIADNKGNGDLPWSIALEVALS